MSSSQNKDTKERNNRTESLPVVSLIPNMITIIALCAGLSSIRFALNERWEMATTFILIASVLDGMDGRFARLLNATSKFGAELDSLADFINFGVAPAIILYLWQDKGIHLHGLGWTLVLLFATCSAIRLARFNSHLDDDIPEWKENFFTGMPAPASASLLMWPMIISFFYENKLGHSGEFPFHISILGIYILFIALIMVSKIPTLSIKKMKVEKEYVPIILVAVVLLMALLIIEPWATLSFIALIYLSTIPFTIIHYLKLKKIHSK